MIRYIGEELINQSTKTGTTREVYGDKKMDNPVSTPKELSEKAANIFREIELSDTDRILFHVSPLHDIMPDLFDVVLASDCDLLLPERSANSDKLARMIAEKEINLVITSLKEWNEIYEAVNHHQLVKQLKLVLIDDGGNLLKRSAWILRSLSADKGNDPYLAYQKARGIWK